MRVSKLCPSKRRRAPGLRGTPHITSYSSQPVQSETFFFAVSRIALKTLERPAVGVSAMAMSSHSREERHGMPAHTRWWIRVKGLAAPPRPHQPDGHAELGAVPRRNAGAVVGRRRRGRWEAYHVDYTTSATVAANARAGSQGGPEITPRAGQGLGGAPARERSPQRRHGDLVHDQPGGRRAPPTGYGVRGSNAHRLEPLGARHGHGPWRRTRRRRRRALAATPGDGRLALSWTAPSGTLTGYDVHYTSTSASDAVPRRRPRPRATTASAAWV